MIDECTLRDQAREAIRQTRLPAHVPDRTLGGLGSGARCVLCGATIERDQMELEIELRRNGKTSDVGRFRLHPRCYAAWELERQNLEIGGVEPPPNPLAVP